MTAIVFGKGPVAIHAAERLLAQGADVRLLVPATTELSNQQKLGDWGRANGVAVADTSDLDAIDGLDADLGLSVFFDRLFRQRHIDRFGRLLNVHNSLLPRHRGVRPINWALKEGDSQHGVSLHEITPGVDDGPVLDQEAFPIDPSVDEVADVYERALEAAIRLLDRTLPEILALPATPQDETLVSSHHSRDDDQLGERRFWRRGDAEFIA
jgi:methionyl-tRNA formyltransferase